MRPDDASASIAQQVQGRLTGWREIAAFFGKSVRTVLRWEKEGGADEPHAGCTRAIPSSRRSRIPPDVET